MKIQQKIYTLEDGWEVLRDDNFDASLSQLVLAFGSTFLCEDVHLYQSLKAVYSNAHILINSTAGEINGTLVNDNTISLTALTFEKTTLKTASVNISTVNSSFDAGQKLASQLNTIGLKNVLVISDGCLVNGSELVLGLQESLPADVIITGGLAGDNAKFRKTLVGLNETPIEGRIAAIGFYGDALTVGYGSVGGWDSFGHERLITKSSGNKLYEMDNKPALDIYKLYLGDFVSDLPTSALLFPLCVREEDSGNSLVRTILSVNEEEKSLTFAGNINQGAYARFMKANLDRLIVGASTAALHSLGSQLKKPDIAILISCVGRKLVLNLRVDEEVEAVRAIYGTHTAIAGFYSNGEIAPTFQSTQSELHNQTMTITTLTEN